jgi:hypothetical protein
LQQENYIENAFAKLQTKPYRKQTKLDAWVENTQIQQFV